MQHKLSRAAVNVKLAYVFPKIISACPHWFQRLLIPWKVAGVKLVFQRFRSVLGLE